MRQTEPKPAPSDSEPNAQATRELTLVRRILIVLAIAALLVFIGLVAARAGTALESPSCADRPAGYSRDLCQAAVDTGRSDLTANREAARREIGYLLLGFAGVVILLASAWLVAGPSKPAAPSAQSSAARSTRPTSPVKATSRPTSAALVAEGESSAQAQLRELKGLHADGLITDEQLEAKQREILGLT